MARGERTRLARWRRLCARRDFLGFVRGAAGVVHAASAAHVRCGAWCCTDRRERVGASRLDRESARTSARCSHARRRWRCSTLRNRVGRARALRLRRRHHSASAAGFMRRHLHRSFVPARPSHRCSRRHRRIARAGHRSTRALANVGADIFHQCNGNDGLRRRLSTPLAVGRSDDCAGALFLVCRRHRRRSYAARTHNAQHSELGDGARRFP